MSDIDICIVGPAGRSTGGVARYIAEHRRVLPDKVNPQLYDIATPKAAGLGISMLYALKDAIRFPFQRRPDIVHVHTSHYRSFYLSAFYIFVTSLLWRRPVVCHVHGSSFDEFVATDSRFVGTLQSAVFEASDRVVVLSEYWADALAHRTDDHKLVVVPNAVDPEEYEPQYRAASPHVIFVSDHVERKGIREFTTAVGNLLDAGMEFKVTIAGTGPLSNHAENLDESYEKVSYVGYVSEAEKHELFSRGTVYVLPTYAEGLPIALLEGMAGGNAIVSTQVGSIPDVVEDENGELVDAGDVATLENTLRSLVDNPTRVEQMARRNRSLIESTYSWNRAAERLTSLYTTLASGEGTTIERTPTETVSAESSEGAVD